MVGQNRNNIPFKFWQSCKEKKVKNKKWGQFHDSLQNYILSSLPHPPLMCSISALVLICPLFPPILARQETWNISAMFLHRWQILWRKWRGVVHFIFRQLPGNQNKTASLHLHDHLYLKDLNSTGSIFEAPKVNVRKGHQTHHAVMHAQPAKSCSQHLISCVCYPLSFSLFHLLHCEWECIVIYRILRDFGGIQLHSFIHFKPSDFFR